MKRGRPAGNPAEPARPQAHCGHLMVRFANALSPRAKYLRLIPLGVEMRASAGYFFLRALVIVLGVSVTFPVVSSMAERQGSNPSANQDALKRRAKPAEGAVRETLKNGLRVVIVPDKLAPVATTVVNYLRGIE